MVDIKFINILFKHINIICYQYLLNIIQIMHHCLLSHFKTELFAYTDTCPYILFVSLVFLDISNYICFEQFQGNLHDYMNILEYLMEKENVLPRLNSRVLSPPKQTLDFSTVIGLSIFQSLFVQSNWKN